MAEPSTGTGRQSRKKCETRRRIWSVVEEEVLVSALNDIVVNGYKLDNGFRPGYLGVLETAMFKKFPGTDLKANPHITSKVCSWRKTYWFLCDMFDKTGLGWNEAAQMIDVDPTFDWDDFVKKEPKAMNMRQKKWPFYNDWCFIFGKDRATGEERWDFNRIDPANEENDNPDATGINASGTGFMDETELNDESQQDTVGSSLNRGKRKRKSTSEDEVVCVLSKLNDDTTSILGALLERVDNPGESSSSRKRKEVDAALKSIEWLTVKQRINVGTYLVKNHEEMEHFFSMVTSDRHVKVQMILDDNFY